jgi:hypothetical protein
MASRPLIMSGDPSTSGVADPPELPCKTLGATRPALGGLPPSLSQAQHRCEDATGGEGNTSCMESQPRGFEKFQNLFDSWNPPTPPEAIVVARVAGQGARGHPGGPADATHNPNRV